MSNFPNASAILRAILLALLFLSSAAAAPPPSTLPATLPSVWDAVTETRTRARIRLGIRAVPLRLTSLPTGLTYDVTARAQTDVIRVEGQGTDHKSLSINFMVLPPHDGEPAVLAHGLRLASANPDLRKQLAIDKKLFDDLLLMAAPQSRFGNTSIRDDTHYDDHFQEHMAAYYCKWLAADRPGKKAVEADWIADAELEGNNLIDLFESQVSANFIKQAAALTPGQKKLLINVATADFTPQAIERPTPHPLIRMKVSSTESWGFWTEHLNASYRVMSRDPNKAEFAANVPIATSAEWLRIDDSVEALLTNPKLAQALQVTDAQLAELRALPLRSNFTITLPDADRDRLTKEMSDYSDLNAEPHPDQLAALLADVTEVGNRVYPPWFAEKSKRDADINDILSPAQRYRLYDLMVDVIEVIQPRQVKNEQ